MQEIIEMGTMSSRGQICIPSAIRDHMGLKEGVKVLFLCENDTLLLKRASWEEITRPLVEAAKKSNFKESDVPDLVHRLRKKWRESP